VIVPGDAATTASQLMASEGLFRIGMAGQSLLFLTEIVMVVMLYVLLKPVSKTLALVAAFARLAMATIQGINLFNHLAALLLLSGVNYLHAFEPDQLYALVLLFLNAYDAVELIWGLFFGLHLFVLGYLVYKSGYIPRILGVLVVVASLAYLVNGFGNMLVPRYKEVLSWVVWATVPAELLFPLWLLIKGTRDPQPATTMAG
jgi:hypothetical protein